MDEAEQAKQLGCSWANNEPKDEKQTKWWWAFILSLLATASMSATALAILIYTDYYKAYDAAAEETTTELTPPRLRRGPGYDGPDSLKTVVSVSLPKNNPNPVVDAYLGRTLRDMTQELTIDPNRPQPQPMDALDGAQPDTSTGFVNLTPEAAKSPVTVVDMTTSRRKQPPERSVQMNRRMAPTTPGGKNRVDQPSNLASVISTPVEQQANKRRRRRRGPKRKGAISEVEL